MDLDGNLQIDWAEWRDFFGLCPAESLDDMVKYWRHSVVSNCALPHSPLILIFSCFQLLVFAFALIILFY